MKKPICLIPARGGSKGVPNKNVKLLGGKPLIAYTIKSALTSKLFQKTIVSTEDLKIAKIAKKYGAEVPFMRPKNLALDNSSMVNVVLNSIIKLQNLGYEFESIVFRDCTVPFIRNLDLRGVLKILDKTKCDSVCAVYQQHHNPYFNMMEKNSNGFLRFSKKPQKKIASRQKAPIVYQLNGLIAFNVEQFLKYKKLYMPKTLPYEISPEIGFMIDTPFEFQIADLIAQKKIKI
jgi:CMP-N-acetylneuraminic acid synthetase